MGTDLLLVSMLKLRTSPGINTGNLKDINCKKKVSNDKEICDKELAKNFYLSLFFVILSDVIINFFDVIENILSFVKFHFRTIL